MLSVESVNKVEKIFDIIDISKYNPQSDYWSLRSVEGLEAWICKFMCFFGDIYVKLFIYLKSNKSSVPCGQATKVFSI